MKVEQFGAEQTGMLHAVSGVGEITHAFVPYPLPPSWQWPTELWPLLLEAHKALSSLDGTGKHLPDPSLVRRPLQNREALKSSSLEGTYTEPKQQLLFELDPVYPVSESDPANASREVYNYAQALQYWKSVRDNLPISLRLIRELHRILMQGVRGSDKNPGEFRRLQNQIGKPARFVPPPPQLVQSSLDHFEKYLYDQRRFDPLVEVFLVHYQFEAIHPFMDGNGRVGRLFLAILTQEWCNLSDQWLYMSSYFDTNKDRYIDLLFKVSTQGAWADWIEFCLKGVVTTAQDTQRRCEQLMALQHDFQSRLRKQPGSVRLAAIVDDLFVTPVASPARLAEKHGVSYPTARADLRKLERAGILMQITGAPQITYYCPQIFDVTYAD